MPFPLAAESYMPHRLPMRLVDQLLFCDENRAEVEAHVDPSHLLLDSNGRLEKMTAIELLAQAQAVAQGYRDSQAGEPVKTGYLVGISRFRIHSSARTGERLHIHVATTAELGDFALVEGEIRAEGRLLAQGALKLWVNSPGG